MKLIIDIPKDTYNKIIDIDKDYIKRRWSIIEPCIYSIRDGIPLPKGHGDLIDADKMIKELNERIQTFDEGRNEILKQSGRPEENHQIPLWLWKGCCLICGIVIEADKENKENE